MSVQHGELTLHALMYITKLIAEQRYGEVLQLGLRQDQADLIQSMTSRDIHDVALSIRGHFLRFHLDPDAFDTAVSVLKRRRADEALDRALILAGARYEMMHQLCGMTTEDYARQRRCLGLVEGRGRPPVPPEPVQASIWQAWLDCGNETNEKQRYLAVHTRTQVPVGTIWRLIGEWESTGLTPVSSTPSPKESGSGVSRGSLKITG